ncbi:MAG: GGDEF domain-containing protein [Lachnospiraceae bacterium]|nr:GGDEF domain-containing protein [Lachnospiraceae bacterium]
MDINAYPQDVKELIYKAADNTNPDKNEIIEYCNKLSEYAKQENDTALEGFAGFTRGETYYLENDMQNFYHEMFACMPLLEENQEWAYLITANNVLGIMSLNRGNAPFAMDYYLKALDLCVRYRLPNLEWLVHMNMGTLYLSVEDERNALAHLMQGYSYIEEHRNDPDYVLNLAVAYVNIGKAYLSIRDYEKAENFWRKLKSECIPNMRVQDLMAVYCFGARLHAELGNSSIRDEYITNVDTLIEENFAVMDVFDDLYEFMAMLLKNEKWVEYNRVWLKIYDLTRITTVIDMERRLLELQLKYFTLIGNEDAYTQTALKYTKVQIAENNENKLMVSNMISLRTGIQDLTNINHRVERENEMLQKKSETDPLTGMFNRFRLNNYWEEAFEKAYQHQKTISIEILDIDFFKEYNDNYGHQAGDICLTTVAKCIKEVSSEYNLFCARYGGDEFIIIFEDYEYEDVLMMVEKIKKKVFESHLYHEYSKISDRVTISQGVCCDIPKGTEKALDFMHSADKMLYEVKEAGKNGLKIGQCIEWGK